MIDVSDGLAADLGHVAVASGATIRSRAGEIPIVPGAAEAFTAQGLDPTEAAIAGGEDYVLAVTMPPDRFAAADSALIEATGFELLAIGSVEEVPAGAEAGAVFEAEDGSPLTAGGHDHFRGPASPSR